MRWLLCVEEQESFYCWKRLEGIQKGLEWTMTGRDNTWKYEVVFSLFSLDTVIILPTRYICLPAMSQYTFLLIIEDIVRL